MTYAKPEILELRKFGIAFGLFFGIFFGLVFPLVRRGWEDFPEFSSWPVWPWAVSFSVVLWAFVNPRSLRVLHRPWMAFAGIAGWINTGLIMLILFFFIVFPVGLIMRLFGYDPMRRKIDKSLPSYRVLSKPQDRNHVERPY